jgi:hypothetical protein
MNLNKTCRGFAHHAKRSERLASAGESVIIDGLCASACTIVLSELPRDKICVTSRALLTNFAQRKSTIK